MNVYIYYIYYFVQLCLLIISDKENQTKILNRLAYEDVTYKNNILVEKNDNLQFEYEILMIENNLLKKENEMLKKEIENIKIEMNNN